jgi:hypothetical protein
MTKGRVNSAIHGTMVFPRGAYRLATAPTRRDLTNAIQLLPNRSLEAELAKAIEPSATARGWVAFDLQRPDERKVANFYRIAIHDAVNGDFTEVVPAPKRYEGDNKGDTDPGAFTLVGPGVNLTKLSLRYYSEPPPMKPTP